MLLAKLRIEQKKQSGNLRVISQYIFRKIGKDLTTTPFGFECDDHIAFWEFPKIVYPDSPIILTLYTVDRNFCVMGSGDRMIIAIRFFQIDQLIQTDLIGLFQRDADHFHQCGIHFIRRQTDQVCISPIGIKLSIQKHIFFLGRRLGFILEPIIEQVE